MRKGSHWPIPTDHLFEGVIFTLRNTDRLIKDAILAYNNKRFTTSLALSTLALEELGKHLILLTADRTKRKMNSSDWINECEKHEQKLLAIPNTLKQFVPRNNKTEIKKIEELEKFLKKLAKIKIDSIYVDWDGHRNKWHYYDDISENEKEKEATNSLSFVVKWVEWYLNSIGGDLHFQTPVEIVELIKNKKAYAICRNCYLVMLTPHEITNHKRVNPSHVNTYCKV